MSNKYNIVKRFSKFLAGMFFMVFGIFSTLAQSPSDNATTAREAINKGITAAKIPDYPLAIKYFEEARKAAPQSPEVFFNLGLAESKIPGRELRAICWFGAYLTANPNAANAAAVKEQINTLLVIAQSNTSRFIKNLQDLAGPLSNDDKNSVLFDVADLFLKTGDLPSAQNIANIIQDDNDKGRVLNLIVRTQMKTGDITGALKTADLIKDDEEKSYAFQNIANAYIEIGKLEDAQKYISFAEKYANNMGYAKYRMYCLLTIAELNISFGNIEGAKINLKSAAKAADNIYIMPTVGIIDHSYDKTIALFSVAEAQIKVKDFDGALKTADLIRHNNYKSHAQALIAEAQIKEGDISGGQTTVVKALKTANGIEDSEPFDKCRALVWVAEAQIKLVDISGAQSTLQAAQNFADKIKDQWDDGYNKSIALTAIAEAKIHAGDLTTAQTILNSSLKIADLIESNAIYLYKSKSLSAVALVKFRAGDKAGSQTILDTLFKIAEQLPKGVRENQQIDDIIVSTLIEMGEIPKAEKAIDLIEASNYRKSNLQSDLAEAKLKKGDILGAIKIADQIQSDYLNRWAHEKIIKVQKKSGKVPLTYADWIKNLEDINKWNSCPLNTGPFLDLASHLNSLKKSEQPKELFNSYYEIGSSIVNAQSVIEIFVKDLKN